MSDNGKATQVYASVLHGPEDLRIEHRTLPPPGPDELQISIKVTGLCGSDVHYFRHYRIGDIAVKEPLTLGHESAGIVVDKGERVHNFNVGDKVALEVGIPCGNCEHCQVNRYNICEEMRFRSSAKSFPHLQGTLQEKLNHPAAWCHKLPETMSLKMGALLEPLSVAIHASRRAQLEKHHVVLVLGAGPVGLLVAAMAKVSGVSRVVVADIDAGRVEFAVENAFAHSGFQIPPGKRSNVHESLQVAKENALAISQNVNGSQEHFAGTMDRVFECTGAPISVQTAIYASKPGGKILLIGMGAPVQMLPISAAALREVDIIGVFRYAHTYPAAIELLSDNNPILPNLSKIVTHRFLGLNSLEDALRTASRTQDESGDLVQKVMVSFEQI